MDHYSAIVIDTVKTLLFSSVRKNEEVGGCIRYSFKAFSMLFNWSIFFPRMAALTFSLL